MAWLATLTEIISAAALLAGFAMRWVCVPLMITMVVAAVTTHWTSGWAAITNCSRTGCRRTARADDSAAVRQR